MAARRGTQGRRARNGSSAGRSAASDREADIRGLYESGVVSTKRIAQVFDLTPAALHRLVRLRDWQRRGNPQPTDAAEGRECPGLRFCPARTDAVARLHHETCDAIKALATNEPTETDGALRERHARTLASLTRTIERVQALDKGILAARPAPLGTSSTAGEHGYDVETLRRELEERIARLRQGGDDASTAERT